MDACDDVEFEPFKLFCYLLCLAADSTWGHNTLKMNRKKIELLHGVDKNFLMSSLGELFSYFLRTFVESLYVCGGMHLLDFKNRSKFFRLKI
jgi:hypothetical protein